MGCNIRNNSTVINDSSPSSQNPKLNTDFDDKGHGFFSDEILEEFLLKKLDLFYNVNVLKFVNLGYEEGVVLNALLRNGRCDGEMDVLTNILNNCLSYLNRGSDGKLEENEAGFVDLRELEEYTLVGMVNKVQEVMPELSRGDAIRFLVISDLYFSRVRMMDSCVDLSCSRFDGGWGFGNGSVFELLGNGFLSVDSKMCLRREIYCPKGLNLSPSMKNLLRRNVAIFLLWFRMNAQDSQMQTPSEQNENTKNQDVVNGMLSKFQDMNLGENMEDVSEDQIKDLEEQVKGRKEWALEKAMQAARKVSNEVIELEMLRMKRDETQLLLKEEKPSPADRTMKQISEIESALRKTIGQVDRANAAFRLLEIENAEIRAEMEALKLSESESMTTLLEATKREKKCVKRRLACDKQDTKMQEEMASVKQKISEVQQKMVEIEASKKDLEAKLSQERKVIELAAAQIEEERRLIEATKASNRRMDESMRLKIEIDFQRHKDDIQRLEQELSQLKASAQSPGREESYAETIASLLDELDSFEDSLGKEGAKGRACVICMEDEVSVVFLPCAHQVVCTNCNEEYRKKGGVTCPCCRAMIEERICAFGPTSS